MVLKNAENLNFIQVTYYRQVQVIWFVLSTIVSNSACGAYGFDNEYYCAPITQLNCICQTVLIFW